MRGCGLRPAPEEPAGGPAYVCALSCDDGLAAGGWVLLMAGLWGVVVFRYCLQRVRPALDEPAGGFLCAHWRVMTAFLRGGGALPMAGLCGVVVFRCCLQRVG